MREVALASAELIVNGEKADVQFMKAEGGTLRSEPLSLEDFERKTSLRVSVTDAGGGVYDWSVGSVSVQPIPLSHEVVWSRPPPVERSTR